MVSALSATSAIVTPCESTPSTPSTMTSASTFTNASNASPNKTHGPWAPDARTDFPALQEAAGSPTWKSGANTRSSSLNGRDDEPVAPSGSKKKWVPIPAAEMQAAYEQANPRSHSHSRTSSRRNSPGELRRSRRLPDDPSFRRKPGFATPPFGSGSKPGTANPSPGPHPRPPIKRKSPKMSAPVSAIRPLPLSARSHFGTIDSPASPPPDADDAWHQLDRHPKQPGRFGVAVGVPLEERNARRTAARRPTSTANDIEDDWTGDGRWSFGVLGTFNHRVGISRGQNQGLPSPQPMLHSPRARGGRGRGMMRGYRGSGYRGGGYRGSPVDPDYAMLPPPGPMPPMDPYNPYGFAPYGYQSYVPVPPMWNPYAPYGVMPTPPPPPMLNTGASGQAPMPVPVTNPGYMLDPMRYYVLGQVEYYFSVQNMYQDLYLRQQMDTQGWIPISTITSFNRLRKLTQDVHLVREMMHLSSLVEVSADGEKARMASGMWSTFVLPDAQDASSSSATMSVGQGAEGTSPATSMDTTEEKSALGLVGVDGDGNAEGN